MVPGRERVFAFTPHGERHAAPAEQVVSVRDDIRDDVAALLAEFPHERLLGIDPILKQRCAAAELGAAACA